MNLIPLIIFVFPVISIVIGVLGYYLLTNIYTAPILVAIISVIAMFTVFNTSFWFWATLYTLLAFLTGLIIKLLSSKKPI